MLASRLRQLAFRVAPRARVLVGLFGLVSDRSWKAVMGTRNVFVVVRLVLACLSILVGNGGASVLLGSRLKAEVATYSVAVEDSIRFRIVTCVTLMRSCLVMGLCSGVNYCC